MINAHVTKSSNANTTDYVIVILDTRNATSNHARQSKMQYDKPWKQRVLMERARCGGCTVCVVFDFCVHARTRARMHVRVYVMYVTNGVKLGFSKVDFSTCFARCTAGSVTPPLVSQASVVFSLKGIFVTSRTSHYIIRTNLC